MYVIILVVTITGKGDNPTVQNIRRIHPYSPTIYMVGIFVFFFRSLRFGKNSVIWIPAVIFFFCQEDIPNQIK